ncbi:MAG: LL-diaminopimelate aminotransferase [Subdoligranulum sp.]|nr:LL-diaminopimelate aminotransferase [Subdoligranulum sp.]MCI7542262.1 LL-diaminopimelate aminotransferase [Subdoligranulum sp.]MDD7266049.1 LL-diaminopimelate aminotransferase [Subdoligranulum sp.]MDY5922861.1 LL-diaminopimelate aminotransferase [Oscillospiraceae bacterium]
MNINKHYAELADSYLFSTVARKAAEFQKANPDREVIKLSIGDVTLPLAKCVVEAMHKAVDEMGTAEGFHGYGPEQGYDFLKDAVRDYYAGHGVNLKSGEIFISDGAKSDLANVLGLFDVNNTVLVPDPVYPTYVDDNVSDGRKVIYAKCDESNNFLPMPDPNVKADIIYICSPSNPTGAVYTPEQLKVWVDHANATGAVILFDAAYECFVSEPGLARSIFEVEGARTCAIEICSFSKIAGFTGTRCGYTVVPEELEREGRSLHQMWLRRQTTKFNGVPYIVQRGAAAVFTESGMAEIQHNLDYYRRNAQVIGKALEEAGVWFCGGKNSPYLWMKCPGGMTSWEFFDYLLEKTGVVGTPGSGFGPCGEGYFRLTAFGNAEKTKIAAELLKKAIMEL